MLNCKKLRRQQPGKGALAYVHPEDAARRRGGLFVSATRATKVSDAEGNEYTAYILRCSYVENGGRVSWEVTRRYNDFFTLHTKLKRYGTVAAELPSRNPFAKMSSVVRSRESGLQEYVQAVLNHCSDKQCNYLAKFLQVQKNLPAYQEKALAADSTAAQPATSSQGHRATDGVDDEGQRGRSTASASGTSPGESSVHPLCILSVNPLQMCFQRLACRKLVAAAALSVVLIVCGGVACVCCGSCYEACEKHAARLRKAESACGRRSSAVVALLQG